MGSNGSDSYLENPNNPENLGSDNIAYHFKTTPPILITQQLT